MGYIFSTHFSHSNQNMNIINTESDSRRDTSENYWRWYYYISRSYNNYCNSNFAVLIRNATIDKSNLIDMFLEHLSWRSKDADM